MHPIYRAGVSVVSAVLALAALIPVAGAQPSPEIGISDVSVDEGGVAAFTVTVRGAHPRLSVDYTTRDGSAIAPGDYPLIADTINIPPSSDDSQVTINVQTVQDTVFEPDETFFVDLSNTIATIRRATGRAIVRNEDPLPVVDIDDVSVTEGDALGSSTDALFNVRLSNPSSVDVTVRFQTADGTARGGVFDLLNLPDYIVKDGRLEFSAGDNATQQIRVKVLGDRIQELNEAFSVSLSNVVNARLGDREATGTVVDQDPRTTIFINDQSLPEGDSGTSLSFMIVSLSNPTAREVTFDVETVKDSAEAPHDFVPLRETRTLVAEQATAFVRVPIVGDQDFELDIAAVHTR